MIGYSSSTLCVGVHAGEEPGDVDPGQCQNDEEKADPKQYGKHTRMAESILEPTMEVGGIDEPRGE